MELFNKRYICFICFAFILTAFLLVLVAPIFKIIVGIIAAIAFVALGIALFKTKKYKFNVLFSLMISFAISLSAFSSYFIISKSQEEAKTLLGENTVLIKIITQSGEDRYDVKLLRVGAQDVSIKSELFFETNEKLEYGDELIMNADVNFASDVYDHSKLLSVSMLDNSDVYINKAENRNYFSRDGIMALCCLLQDKFSSHIDRVFGDHAAIAKGLLVNDTSDLDVKTNTDFKRSGTSHILAVSGTHVVLLMGALELLLRKLHVKKEIRIVIISIASLFFLALCGFVASAVRSVLMLYAVYLSYILYEENDSITALFVSISIIILCSPFSVYDLGMWMSFLATLGILAVYPYFDERMPYPKQENLFVRYSLRLLIWIAKSLILTIIANFFLIPIMWYFFGAISLSTVPCNLILGPVVAVLMPLCAFTALVGFIPYVSIPFVFITNKIFDVMMFIVRSFSKMRFGVISLQYEFAIILVAIFTVVMIAMLVIKFKHKLVIFIPMVSFVVAFAVCVTVFNYTSKPNAKCIEVYNSEIIFVNNGSECNVIDSGKGYLRKGKSVLKNMSKYATEIDEYFIIEPDAKHIDVLETVCENTIIRKLYLPKVLVNSDLLIYYEILKCAEKYNISVELYKNDCDVEICNGVCFNYIDSDEFSVFSQSVMLTKAGSQISCKYQDNVYGIDYKDGVSKTIPLN